MPKPPRFYNTLTHRLEPFTPIQPGKVSMYNCGPTVYDFAHIGNFKTFVFADVLRRFLELAGHDVHQVMNLTDVGHMTDDALADGGGEDKMQKAAERLRAAKKAGQAHADAVADPDDPYQVARFYIDAFLQDARLLRLKVADEYPANMPRATDHVRQMLQIVGTLLEKDHAYVGGDGAAYFRVQSFPEYGRLSGNTLDQLRGGAGGRVDAAHQAVKRHPADFLLWKPDPTHLMRWDPATLGLQGPAARLGEGYPGWHIECSAMARAVLGRDVIDLHTGGEDNIFPHHECEIAQSVAATDDTTLQRHGHFRGFARFWMHSRHLMVEGAKMSKSAGNFFTVRQVLDGAFTGRPVDPAVLRFELLKANYRSQMDFTRKGLLDSASAVKKLRDAHRKTIKTGGVDLSHPVVTRFADALADDLNISGALGVVFGWLKSEWDATSEESRGVLDHFDRVLDVRAGADRYTRKGIDAQHPHPLLAASTLVGDSSPDLAAKCAALDAARAAKDFAAADAIRAELQDAGYEVKTTAQGTVATRKLA